MLNFFVCVFLQKLGEEHLTQMLHQYNIKISDLQSELDKLSSASKDQDQLQAQVLNNECSQKIS